MDDHNPEAGRRSFLAETLRNVTFFSAKRPWLTTIAITLSAVACVYYSYQHLRFKTDRGDLISPSAPFHQRWLKFTEDFGEDNDMVVVVESNKPETIKSVIETIGSRLQQSSAYFTNILFKVEPGKLREKGLQYLPPEMLSLGLERLESFRPMLGNDWDQTRFEAVISSLKRQLDPAQRLSGSRLDLALDHAEHLTNSLSAYLADRNQFPNPWPEILPVDPKLAEQENQTVYLLNEEGTMGFVMASPVDAKKGFDGATSSIDKLREIIREVSAARPDAKISLTGIPVLENDEMRRSQQDMAWASLISYLGVAALMFLGFRGFLHPILGLLMLVIGMAWSFGFTTFAVGHLNILSVSFVSILIGLGIDFAIHIMSKYLELRHQGRPLRMALIETSESIGAGIITGAVTTSLAFFCATFTDFLGVAELGIIACGGIMLCAFAAFTFLPALVSLADQKTSLERLPKPFEARWLRAATRHQPILVLFASLGLFGYVGFRSFDWQAKPLPRPLVYYDHNLLNLQADGLESVIAQKHIFEGSKHSLLYAISVADSPEEAKQLKEKFLKLESVHHVVELASRLPDSPPQKTQLLVQAFRADLSRLPPGLPNPVPVNPRSFGELMDDLHRTIARRTDPRSQQLANRLDQFLEQFVQLDSGIAQMKLLTEFQARMSWALLMQFKSLYAASNADPVEIEDLPTELAARFISRPAPMPEGKMSPGRKWLVQVFPRDQIWDMEPLERFVQDVRSVDPDVTGTPLQNYEAALQIKRSYEICAVYALVVILLVLIMDFLRKELLLVTFLPPLAIVLAAYALCQTQKIACSPMYLMFAYTGMVVCLATWLDIQSIFDTLLAMSPPVVGLGLTLGLLVIFNIPLNPANLIILPLILGIGVDNGVHIMHDYHSRPREIYCPAASTVNAIIMTSTTTMVGFGSMLIAAHRGLYSLGAVLTIGVGSCLFLSLVTLPAALSLASRRRERVQAAVEAATNSKDPAGSPNRQQASVA